MTDNEIIKALEWLERLKRDTDVSEWSESLKIILNEYNRQKAENERLEKELMKCKLEKEMLHQTVEEIKSEAIKEFIDELKNRVVNKYEYTDIRVFKEIDDLVKEMTEEFENDDTKNNISTFDGDRSIR